MSDDEPDLELLELLRKSLGLNSGNAADTPKIRVLEDAKFVYDNSVDVALDMQGTKHTARTVFASMQEKGYDITQWRAHDLHPKAQDASTVEFIFVMDLLNFSFWSAMEKPEEQYAVEYHGKRWTGYWSLVASLQRAIEEEIPITEPAFWIDEELCSDEVLKHVFRSCTTEEMPLLTERMAVIREAGHILDERFDGTFLNLLEDAKGSAAALVDLLVRNFEAFDDAHGYEGRKVRFQKRAQILVADLWACFEGEGYGYFYDIDQITIFSDYRIPQTLCSLGCLKYSPSLEGHVRKKKAIESGHSWEIQIRGCTIWCVELMRQEILRNNPEARVNAILIDFFLYDSVKEMEKEGKELIPHHRTRSIWY